MVNQEIFLYYCLGLALVVSLDSIQANDNIGCYTEVECVGATSTGVAHSTNAEECHDLCHDVTGCNYFTYYTASSYCFTYANCPEINSECEDCISGTTKGSKSALKNNKSVVFLMSHTLSCIKYLMSNFNNDLASPDDSIHSLSHTCSRIRYI